MRTITVLAVLALVGVLSGCDESDSSGAGAAAPASAVAEAPPRRRPAPPPATFVPRRERASSDTDSNDWSRGREFFDGGGYGGAAPSVFAAAAPKTVAYTAAAPTRSPDVSAPPPPPADADWTARVTAYGDAKMKLGGTVGLCYGGVKRLLRKFQVVSSFTGDKRWRDDDGRPVRENELVSAYQFPRWVENHPSLHGRRLVRIDRPAWPLTVGDIVVWGRGVCGYRGDGHIEMLYRIRPDGKRAWAVSDHSQEFDVACFTREARRVSAARDALAAPGRVHPKAARDAIRVEAYRVDRSAPEPRS